MIQNDVKGKGKVLRVATVFSGIGAPEQAFKRLGINHEIVFACDTGEVEIEYDLVKERDAISKLKTPLEKKLYVDELYASKTRKSNFVKKSYLANYAKDMVDENMFFQDIRLLDGKDFKDKVDILIGGSPCQSFSTVGFQGGLEDTRGTLFYDYANLIKDVNPKVFIYENVRGLKNHDKGKTWNIMKNAFDELGYHIDESILNARDYGIPQIRQRLFVIGIRKDIKLTKQFEFPKGFELPEYVNDMHKFLEDKVTFGHMKYVQKDTNNNMGALYFEETSEEEKLNQAKYLSKYVLSQKLYDYVMKGGTKTFYQKPVIDKAIARTLLKTMGNHHRAGVDNYIEITSDSILGEDTIEYFIEKETKRLKFNDTKDFVDFYYNDKDARRTIRMLTPREAHRLMGFTDDYKIVVSDAQAYKQAGNSIVVDVVMAILKEIFKTGALQS
ncbi:DNA cytosine methyltransferase [Sharpea azabuensis]|uniref:DNA cytosine methyltransferase n=1 Tax=Sharpea azabuensis TaxID=322505 RepID=UPI0013DCC00B|nr:DNA (cytosine-5-)-methyltransferase [Sharpea azabuensis]